MSHDRATALVDEQLAVLEQLLASAYEEGVVLRFDIEAEAFRAWGNSIKGKELIALIRERRLGTLASHYLRAEAHATRALIRFTTQLEGAPRCKA